MPDDPKDIERAKEIKGVRHTNDQFTGMIRDSDTKFKCRMLLMVIHELECPEAQKQLLYELIRDILRLENERLDKLAEEGDANA